MLNAMTIDLEDWALAVLGPGLPVTDHVVANTQRVLDLLSRAGIRATFFALGRVCERFPQLLAAVSSAGHEIASHGYGHELIYHLTPASFEADLQKSIQVIESQTGRRPIGYRAPAFSITRQSLWAGPILARLGFRYSSSIFPIHKERYGIGDWPTTPSKWPGCDLVEFPLSTLRLAGRNWPACGGGYTRLLPGAIMAHAIRRLNRVGQPAVIYLHPYELVPGEVRAFMRTGTSVSAIRRFTQELWRSRVAKRLSRLFGEFRFGTMSASLAEYRPLAQPDAMAAAATPGMA
jgi:polysaccharide deacetylase family protein (PEP-CTERM system associated)